MMKRRAAILLYLFSLTAALYHVGCESPPSENNHAEEIANSYYSTGWAVGHWVRYDYTTSGSRSSLYVAITDSERVGDETYFWLETVRQSGTVITGTRQLIIYFDDDSFLEASGGLLPGATRYVAKPAYSSPTEKTLAEGRATPLLNYERIFGGGEDVEIISVDENAEYTTLSGKDMVCVRKILMLDEKNAGSILTTRDVPITGIAYSDGNNRKLELVDFGFSGASSVF
jgi:hypothetical protein